MRNSRLLGPFSREFVHTVSNTTPPPLSLSLPQIDRLELTCEHWDISERQIREGMYMLILLINESAINATSDCLTDDSGFARALHCFTNPRSIFYTITLSLR